MEIMAIKVVSEKFVFDPRQTTHYLHTIETAKPDLLPILEQLLDNGLHNDDYRPINTEIFSKIVKCLNKNDLSNKT